MNMSYLGECTVWLDCDVIQADGGTRTASITGAFVALVDLLASMDRYDGKPFPVIDYLSAVSVGIVGGQAMLDLCYEEDSRAEVDMNVVMTGAGGLVEVQGTAEGAPFTRGQLNGLLDLASAGIGKLSIIQHEVLGDVASRIIVPESGL